MLQVLKRIIRKRMKIKKRATAAYLKIFWNLNLFRLIEDKNSNFKRE